MLHGRRNRRGTPDAMLLLLLAQLYTQVERLPIKPPVTLALAALQVLAHVRPDLAPPLGQVCLAPRAIVAALRRGHGAFNAEVPLRLLGSSFMHADDFHLFYNIGSLLWKGCQLEQALGPQLFLELTTIALVLASALAVAFHAAFDAAGWHALGSLDACSVGFSGVLFAYKYVLTFDARGETVIHHIFRVPAKHAAWAELVLISLLSPRASFAGHLAGIAAGAVYVHTPKAITAAARRVGVTGGARPRYTPHAAPTGRRAEPPPQAAAEPTPARPGAPAAEPRPAARPRYQYRAEAIGHAASHATSAPAPAAAPPDAAELRRRRVARLGGS